MTHLPRTKIRYGPDASQFGHLYLPPAPTAAAEIPLVVLVHGGYWTTEFGLVIESAVARLLATRGCAVWNIEYRRVGEAGGGWPATGRDVVTAIGALDDRVREAVPADLRDRIGWRTVAVVGHSAGGQLAVWAVAQLGARTERTVITTVVAQSAVLDMVAAADRRSVQDLMGRPYAESPRRYHEASPVEQAPFGAHVVAIHAGADDSIPVAMSRAYVDTVAAAGQSVDLVVVPDEGHSAFVEPHSQCTRHTVRVLGV